MNTFRVCFRLYQTHYEVLNLPRNCSSKEIKNAFIKLSKEHHPDVNKSKQSHVRFQAINEAYKVLGKAESRRSYDLGLVQEEEFPYVKKHPGYDDHASYGKNIRNPYSDPTFWANRDKKRDHFYKEQPYYGINGIPRLSNGTILMFCVFFSFIGVCIQYVAISQSTTLKRDELIRRSLETEKILNRTKETANVNGNPAQLEALKSRLLGQVSSGTDK